MDFNSPALSVNPESIAQMNGVLPENMPLMNFWRQNAQGYDLAKLAEFEAARQQAAQTRPYDLEQKRLANMQTLAQIANQKALTQGHGIKNENDQLNLDIRRKYLPQEEEAALNKMLSESSADQLKKAEAQVYLGLQSSDPVVKQKSQMLLPMLKAQIEQRQKQEHEISRQVMSDKAAMARTQAHEGGATARNNASIKAQMDLEQKRIDAGKYTKAGRSSSFETFYLSLKKASEKHSALIDAAKLAEQEGNTELAASYLARAAEQRPQAEAELRLLQPGGQPDLSKRTPVTPQPSIAPGAKPGTRENPIKLD